MSLAVEKKVIVLRFASVRFDVSLASRERDAAARAIGSVGATVTSWSACEGRTYATVSFSDPVVPEMLARSLDARIDAPPRLVLRVTPDRPRMLAGLGHAFGGPGRPAGILDFWNTAGAIVLECDSRVTPVATLIALIAAELATAPGRTIEPLVGIDDATLVALARAALAEPDLDEDRLIETHLAAALAVATS